MTGRIVIRGTNEIQSLKKHIETMMLRWMIQQYGSLSDQMNFSVEVKHGELEGHCSIRIQGDRGESFEASKVYLSQSEDVRPVFSSLLQDLKPVPQKSLK